MRIVSHRYEDPLDVIWTHAAARLGLRIVRCVDVYASTDGQGTLAIGIASTLDPDDCLAQMVLHEVCHWLVQGEGANALPDWGLENISDRDVVREHACLRTQAALTAEFGLRQILAPTTEFRSFYDELGETPVSDDASSKLARKAISRATSAPWNPALREALEATAQISRIVARSADEGSLYSLIA